MSGFCTKRRVLVRRFTLRERIERRIARKRSEDVFLPREFRDLGGEDQVLRALRILVREKRLVRLGYRVYGRAVVSRLSVIPLTRSPLQRRGRRDLPLPMIRVKLGATLTYPFSARYSRCLRLADQTSVQSKVSRRFPLHSLAVLAQPEMEKQRSPLVVNSRPLRRTIFFESLGPHCKEIFA